jgi:asparagine synthase (glutamine-hydrolysing)
VNDVLSEPSLRSRGLFDPKGVRELVEADRERRVDAAYSIFSMICIELWCRMFVDQPRPSAG